MITENELKRLIRKYAVKNAFDYGKAAPGSVIGKVMPFAKGVPVSEIKEEVEKTVKEVNKLKKADLEKEYSEHKEEFGKKAEETAKRTAMPKLELEGAVAGKFATRWPPEPSGYQHIGHAKPIFLEAEFVRMYKGKFFLYFDDTNPEKEHQEFVDADKKDLEWLGIKFDKEYYASDNLDKIYECARKLIKDGNAYVCFCKQEEMKTRRLEMQPCEHRDAKPDANSKEFEKMLAGKYKDGEAVLRYKGDMKSQNTAMRDPTIARLKSDKHYRQGTKYHVWPTYDLAAPIMDSTNGITHVMRSKEYELRDELDTKILKALGMRVPKIVPFSRLNIHGNITHKREIRKLISDGIIKDWDDPRLMTFIALKRRGIMPEAIRNFVLKVGMTKTDSTVPLEMLLAENKKIINGIARHLFFVDDPMELNISNFKKSEVSLELLPGGQSGSREYTINGSLLISGKDAKALKEGENIRLKDFTDLKIASKGKHMVNASEEKAGLNSKIIHWIPKEGSVKCRILVPGQLLDKNGNVNPISLEIIEGHAEPYVIKINEQEIVQFERFGYCILDNKKSMQFIFISK